MAGVASVAMDNNVTFEKRSSTSRITKGGRKLTYQLSVTQQPERARACGSGAKSSTDRRPVDPPPIVDLRIFDGEKGSQSEITSLYNANFFLYATLENARPIAHGHVPQPQGAASVPVLTGTAVAGMVYLDRPSKAGYFIFPDLSIRHEGKYRLCFTLFEEAKEDRDKDVDEKSAEADAPGCPQQIATRRLHVKSVPFIVYSAKKFPGLAESTALSRLVADQGCRVRIRRDVRMRRRDNKNSKDWNDYEDDVAADRARRTATPSDLYGHGTMPKLEPNSEGLERTRSVSDASVASYSMQPQRRASSQDLGHQYHHAYMAPQMSSGNPQSGFMPQMAYGAPSPYPQAQYAMHHAVAQSPHSLNQFSPAFGFPQQQNFGYVQQQQVSPPMYEQPVSHVRQDSGMNHGAVAASYERPSSMHSQYQSGGSIAVSDGSLDAGTSRPMHSSHQSFPSLAQQLPPNSALASASNGASLPPLRTLQPSPETTQHSNASSAHPDYVSPTRAVPPQYVSSSSSLSTKRSFATVFDSQHIDQPLRGGARPDASGDANALLSDEASDEESFDIQQLRMSYRRADGRQTSRPCPPSN